MDERAVRRSGAVRRRERAVVLPGGILLVFRKHIGSEYVGHQEKGKRTVYRAGSREASVQTDPAGEPPVGVQSGKTIRAFCPPVDQSTMTNGGAEVAVGAAGTRDWRCVRYYGGCCCWMVLRRSRGKVWGAEEAAGRRRTNRKADRAGMGEKTSFICLIIERVRLVRILGVLANPAWGEGFGEVSAFVHMGSKCSYYVRLTD